MPVVEVNGEEYEFPDSMGDEEIKAILRKKFSPPKTTSEQWGQGGRDAAATTVRGLVKTAAFPITAAGDLVYGVGNYLTNQNLEAPFGSSALEKILPAAPKTIGHRFAEAGISGASAGGAFKAALPGAAGSLAYQAAEEVNAPLPVKIAAAIAGGAAPSAIKGTVQGIKGAIGEMGADKIDKIAMSMRSAAGGMINESKQAGAVLSGSKFKNVVGDLKRSVGVNLKSEMGKRSYPGTADMFKALETDLKKGMLGNIDSLHNIRKLINRKLQDAATPDDVHVLGLLKDKFDDTLASLKREDFEFGKDVSEEAIKQFTDGLAAYKNYMNFEDVATVLKKAGGDKNKIVTGFKKFMEKPRFKSLTPKQQELVKTAAKVGVLEKPAGWLGAFGVDFRRLGETQALFPSATGAGVAGAFSGSVPVAASLVGAGTAAKELTRGARIYKGQAVLKDMIPPGLGKATKEILPKVVKSTAKK